MKWGDNTAPQLYNTRSRGEEYIVDTKYDKTKTTHRNRFSGEPTRTHRASDRAPKKKWVRHYIAERAATKKKTRRNVHAAKMLGAKNRTAPPRATVSSNDIHLQRLRLGKTSALVLQHHYRVMGELKNAAKASSSKADAEARKADQAKEIERFVRAYNRSGKLKRLYDDVRSNVLNAHRAALAQDIERVRKTYPPERDWLWKMDGIPSAREQIRQMLKLPPPMQSILSTFRHELRRQDKRIREHCERVCLRSSALAVLQGVETSSLRSHSPCNDQPYMIVLQCLGEISGVEAAMEAAIERAPADQDAVQTFCCALKEAMHNRYTLLRPHVGVLRTRTAITENAAVEA